MGKNILHYRILVNNLVKTLGKSRAADSRDPTVLVFVKTTTIICGTDMAKKRNDENKNGKNNSNNKFLITINILGSTGPIRFVVNEDDTVSEGMDAAQKLYAHQERFPVFGSDVNSFLLYPANAGLDTLNLSESIGLPGVRNFVLCKKQRQPQMTAASKVGDDFS
nr:uncharacterized protein LOC113739152 [Coffea arabica]